MTDTQYAKYLKYLANILTYEDLPSESRDHGLSGKYSGFREFHIGGDLLIVYIIENNILRLTRIGSHSQLFN